MKTEDGVKTLKTELKKEISIREGIYHFKELIL